jgi:hypothetical protein
MQHQADDSAVNAVAGLRDRKDGEHVPPVGRWCLPCGHDLLPLPKAIILILFILTNSCIGTLRATCPRKGVDRPAVDD